jgi:hypothetical protein
MIARASRVRALIGDAHWLTDGSHKERLVSGFLEPRLPAGTQLGHGFALDLKSNSCSREIDIFVRDQSHSPPFFDEGHVNICDAASVIAFLEVKSTFDASSLADALGAVIATQSVIGKSRKAETVWRAICFSSCDPNKNLESIADTIIFQLKKLREVSGDKNPFSLAVLPTCIVCLENFCAFLSGRDNGSGGRLRLFKLEKMSFAAAVSDLLSHLYTLKGAARDTWLENEIDRICKNAPLVREF